MRSRPLSDLVQACGVRAGEDTAHPVYSVTKHDGFVPSEAYFKKQVFSRDLSDYKRVRPGDFAYASIHLDEGAIGIAPVDGLISPMYTVFESRNDVVDSQFLLRFMKSPVALSQYPRFGKGSVHRRKSISLDALGKLEVPLPTLEEQRLIARVLKQSDDLRAIQLRMLSQLRELRLAAIADFVRSCGGQEYALTDLVDSDDRLNYGVVQPGPDMEDGVPLVRVSDLKHGRIRRTELKAIAPDIDRAHSRSRLRGTEVLIVCVGATIGQVAVASAADIGSNVARAVARIPISDADLRAFVAAYLETAQAQQYFKGELRTVAQPTLNIKQLGELRVPLPDNLSLRAIRARMDCIQSQSEKARSKLSSLDELRSSLQSRAFSGAL